jgi:lysozyme
LPRGNTYSLKSDAKPHPGVIKARSKPIHGIDVSRWQADIDWPGGETGRHALCLHQVHRGRGPSGPRVSAELGWREVRRHSGRRYHFVYWCRPAVEQVQWFVQHIPQDPDALPPVLDLEWNGHLADLPEKGAARGGARKIRVMLTELERHTGKRPIIYTDITFHREVLEGEFQDYPYWLRSVAAEPEERYLDRPFTFWQWTTTGRVPASEATWTATSSDGGEAAWQAFVDGKYPGGFRDSDEQRQISTSKARRRRPQCHSRRVAKRRGKGNCVVHGVWKVVLSRTMALMMPRSFRATATMTGFAALPLAFRVSAKAFMRGLLRAAVRAAM